MSSLTIVLLTFGISTSFFAQLLVDDPTQSSSTMLLSDRIQTSLYPKILSYFVALLPFAYCLHTLHSILSSKFAMQILGFSYFVTYELFRLVPILTQLFNLIFVIKMEMHNMSDRKLPISVRLRLALTFAMIRFFLASYHVRRTLDTRAKRLGVVLIDLSLMILVEASLLRYATRYLVRIVRKIFLAALLYQLNDLYGNQTFWSSCEQKLQRYGFSDGRRLSSFLPLQIPSRYMRNNFLLKLAIDIRWIFILATITVQGLPILFISINNTNQLSPLPITIFSRIMTNCLIILSICFLLLMLSCDANQFWSQSTSSSFEFMFTGVHYQRSKRNNIERAPADSTLSMRRIKSPRSTKRTCQVCYNDKAVDEFELIVLNDCQHKQRAVCDSCLFEHVKKTFEVTFTDDIFCPEPSCAVKFSYNTVKTIFQFHSNDVLMERYDKYVANREIEKMDEFIWCSNPSCHAGQLNEGGAVNMTVTCYHCRQKTCFIHKVKWHEGMTCDEYTRSLDENQNSSRKWIQENCKKCPNCPFDIQKNDGCDHMTCIKCRHEFCWSCLADFQPIRRDGKHQHRPTCKHYSATRR